LTHAVQYDQLSQQQPRFLKFWLLSSFKFDDEDDDNDNNNNSNKLIIIIIRQFIRRRNMIVMMMNFCDVEAVEAKRKSMSALLLERLQKVSDRPRHFSNKWPRSKLKSSRSSTWKHQLHNGKDPVSSLSAKHTRRDGLYVVVFVGVTLFRESLRLRRFKSDRDKMWQYVCT